MPRAAPVSNQRLHGKVVVIIGGTSGMGLSAVMACSREGARIVATGLDEESAQHTRDLLPGSPLHVLVSDATDPDSADLAIQTAVNHFGKFDALYHVAGGSGRKWGDGPLHEISSEAWSPSGTKPRRAHTESNRIGPSPTETHTRRSQPEKLHTSQS